METEGRHHHHHHRDGSEQRSSGRKEHYSRRAGQNRHTKITDQEKNDRKNPVFYS